MFMEATFDDAANIDAINRYIAEAKPLTPAGAKAKDEWRIWHDGLSWYDKTFPSVAVYDYARNLKNKFNLANAPTAAEKAAVQLNAQTGVTSEQMRGEVDRRLTSGAYNTEEYAESLEEPFIPTRIKVVAGLAAVTWFGGKYLKKVYVDPFLRRVKRT